ncbi:kinase-associated lipoprotein B [Bacillus sp. FJAT-49736]|uniref:kinase-associated lipoprotein B n=1 Tax=Bacillus sp. FJAT-49736 TaxID=2833582 RepID=UPI001BC97114|nr:kinase-associated lipoprotein B [Bacillus sp. FJAT-49736]MBS4173927.1 kinase-associated lipoprotein B [Bacillus sp. FJAT-49736]
MEIGQIVTFFNKTGKYVGEITACYSDRYLVKTLAVLKHPMQGDLHHPKETEVAFFHERKALAYREQTNIPLKMVKPYEGDVPDYSESLQDAFHKLYGELNSEENAFNRKSIECLNSIQKEYAAMYSINW